MLSMIFAAIVFLIGLAALLMSIPEHLTSEYLVLVAIAAFTLSGVFGIWYAAGALAELVDESKKNHG